MFYKFLFFLSSFSSTVQVAVIVGWPLSMAEQMFSLRKFNIKILHAALCPVYVTNNSWLRWQSISQDKSNHLCPGGCMLFRRFVVLIRKSLLLVYSGNIKQAAARKQAGTGVVILFGMASRWFLIQPWQTIHCLKAQCLTVLQYVCQPSWDPNFTATTAAYFTYKT